MALKRTEIKRSKIARKHRKDQGKKERSNARKLSHLANIAQYQLACSRVDIRDRGRCRECGERYGLEHHHARFRSAGGKDDEDNIVLLCGWCHRLSPKAPHNSAEGREKWVEYLAKRYPEYWKTSRKSQEITPRYSRAIGG